MKWIVLLLLGFLVLGVSSLPISEAVSCDFCKIKVVITFEHSATLSQITTAYTDNARPALISLFQGFITDNNLTVTQSYVEPASTSIHVLGVNQTSGNNIYQLYPKAVISASNNQTPEEFNLAWDTFVAQSRQSIVNYLQSNGATDVKTFLYYSWGSAEIDEGF